MRVRHKETGLLGSSSHFNICGMSEIIVGFDDEPDCDWYPEMEDN